MMPEVFTDPSACFTQGRQYSSWYVMADSVPSASIRKIMTYIFFISLCLKFLIIFVGNSKAIYFFTKKHPQFLGCYVSSVSSEMRSFSQRIHMMAKMSAAMQMGVIYSLSTFWVCKRVYTCATRPMSVTMLKIIRAIIIFLLVIRCGLLSTLMPRTAAAMKHAIARLAPPMSNISISIRYVLIWFDLQAYYIVIDA